MGIYVRLLNEIQNVKQFEISFSNFIPDFGMPGCAYFADFLQIGLKCRTLYKALHFLCKQLDFPPHFRYDYIRALSCPKELSEPYGE